MYYINIFKFHGRVWNFWSQVLIYITWVTESLHTHLVLWAISLIRHVIRTWHSGRTRVLLYMDSAFGWCKLIMWCEQGTWVAITFITWCERGIWVAKACHVMWTRSFGGSCSSHSGDTAFWWCTLVILCRPGARIVKACRSSINTVDSNLWDTLQVFGSLLLYLELIWSYKFKCQILSWQRKLFFFAVFLVNILKGAYKVLSQHRLIMRYELKSS